MKKKTSSQRIRIEKEDDRYVITILPLHDSAKSRMMLIWLILWLVCGAVVLYEMFGNHSREEKMVLLVYLAFWCYFAYRISRVYRWRQSGREEISIKDQTISIGKFTAGRGFVNDYHLQSIGKPEIAEINPTSFAAVFAQSYWMEGNEGLFFLTNTKQRVGFGLQLSNTEQQVLLKEINRLIKSSLSST
ncbi:MAG: hypothetical protein ACK5JC_02590 [Bacteroidota bacterium]|jgi:hypothetical protein